MPKRQIIGLVTGDKMQKTRRVEIERQVRHPKYGKFLRRRGRVDDAMEMLEAAGDAGL